MNLFRPIYYLVPAQSVAKSIDILVNKANGPLSLLRWGITMDMEDFLRDLNTIKFTIFLLFYFYFTRQKEPQSLKHSDLIKSPRMLRVLGHDIQSSMEPLCTMSQGLEDCAMLRDIHPTSCPDLGAVAIHINQFNFLSVLCTFPKLACT